MRDAAVRSGRNEASARLVAVTTRSPLELVRPLVELGLADLGENYPQELWTSAAGRWKGGRSAGT